MGKGKYKRKKPRDRQATPITADLNGTPTKVKDDENRSRLREAIERSSVTDWLLALFTFVLAVAAIYQFIIMNGQLDTMRKDQRAWLTITNDDNKPTMTNTLNAIPASTVVLSNTGKTPATNIVGNVYVEIVQNGSAPNFEAHFMHTLHYSGLVLPNSPQGVFSYRRKAHSEEGDPLKQDETSALADGSAWVAVYGEFSYDDVFKGSHWTKFCFWKTFKPGGYQTASCASYNSTDDK